jgi:hypothetical protein
MPLSPLTENKYITPQWHRSCLVQEKWERQETWKTPIEDRLTWSMGTMETDSVKGAKTGLPTLAARRENRKPDFAKVLGEQEGNRNGVTEYHSRKTSSIRREATKDRNPTLLGTIMESQPTISHLLVGHPEYGRDCWAIIQSEQNRNKPYTKIQPGTAIFIDPKTLELTWDRGGTAHLGSMSAALLDQLHPGSESETSSGPDSSTKQSITTSRAHSPSSSKVTRSPTALLLGTITQSKPTISHLLIEHPQYGRDCWRIIHSEPNRNKPYTKIEPGTAIFIDPETLEISWGGESPSLQPIAPPVQAAQSNKASEYDGGDGLDSFSTRLAKAVESYIGRSYEEIDCYELLVRGLAALGIRYHGSGGLMEKLVEMAARQGLPRNAYLNGEGLIEASGTKVYSKSFIRILDSEAQASRFMNELDPFLKKGFIISFSTHTNGHTGIVSQKNGDWTFINSGKMNHHLQVRNDSRHVGEESLREEIKDWFELAAARKESLKITVGRLDENKLATFIQRGSSISEEA